MLVTDSVGQSGHAAYVPTVQAPAPPVTPTVTGSATIGHPVSVDITVPSGGTLRLWDGSHEATSLTVAGQGVYTVDGEKLVFTAVDGFSGDPAPVSYQVTDAYGQSSRGVFKPTITSGETPAPGTASPTTIDGRKGSPTAVTPLDNVSAATDRADQRGPEPLRVAGSAHGRATRRLVLRSGSWVARADGSVRFRPARGFVGVATAWFEVRTSGGVLLRSSMSVVVRGVVTGHRSATVYFAVRSSHLSPHARAVLRRLAAHVPSGRRAGHCRSATCSRSATVATTCRCHGPAPGTSPRPCPAWPTSTT